MYSRQCTRVVLFQEASSRHSTHTSSFCWGLKDKTFPYFTHILHGCSFNTRRCWYTKIISWWATQLVHGTVNNSCVATSLMYWGVPYIDDRWSYLLSLHQHYAGFLPIWGKGVGPRVVEGGGGVAKGANPSPQSYFCSTATACTIVFRPSPSLLVILRSKQSVASYWEPWNQATGENCREGTFYHSINGPIVVNTQKEFCFKYFS